jgi:hypothetical protein
MKPAEHRLHLVTDLARPHTHLFQIAVLQPGAEATS